jgi:DNA-binding XRE family transcriptional regulator
MSLDQQVTNRVRTCRVARGWSQDDLATRAGISRAGVSAIETGRLVPSTSAALALAAVMECRVEDLFQLSSATPSEMNWAWQPRREPCRYWRATVSGRELLYPTEPTDLGVIGHDGVYQDGKFREQLTTAPSDTLVVASCDPAIGLLADDLARRSSFRLLAFPRSSQEALVLLAQGTVHVAGIHLATGGQREQNSLAAKEKLRGGFCMLRGARWQEGLALAPGLKLPSVRAALDCSGESDEKCSVARKTIG